MSTESRYHGTYVPIHRVCLVAVYYCRPTPSHNKGGSIKGGNNKGDNNMDDNYRGDNYRGDNDKGDKALALSA